jgi:fluoroquinolone transport system permease protein
MRRILGLLAGDYRNVARDPLLVYLPLAPFLLLLSLRLVVPWITDLVSAHLDLVLYYPFITGFLIIMTPLMVGMVSGFILLDERDENILTAIVVTPLSKNGFLLYKLSATTILSFILNVILVGALSLVPFRPLALLPPALMASAEAPLLALFMAAAAGNKVEGLVLAKASGLLFLAPLAIIFLPADWQLVAGILPTYWVTRCFLAIYRPEHGYALSLIIGLAYHALLFGLLLKAFNRRVG